jgi:hypothetical protein
VGVRERGREEVGEVMKRPEERDENGLDDADPLCW